MMNDKVVADHLIPLTERWALWRCVGVRGAGFPVEAALQLGSDELAQATQSRLACEQARTAAYNQALAAINQALDELRAAGGWQDLTQREPLVKALWSLKENRLPAGPLPAAIQAVMNQLAAAEAALVQAEAGYDQAYEAANQQQSALLQAVAAEPRFAEAVIWQNRQAFQQAILPLRERPERIKAKKRRQKEELVANYLQRYSLKNDTIGFFGPVGWGHISDEPATQIEPGEALLATRTVYFEGWGIDTIANQLSQNMALRPWMSPRFLPLNDLQGNTLYQPGRRPVVLPELLAAVLRRCTGQQTAQQIAHDLIQDGNSGFRTEADVYKILDSFLQRQLIAWRFEIPVDPFPDRILRAQLMGISDETLRQEALGYLEPLEQARADIAAAAGQPERLEQAIQKLETVFTEITDTAPTRAPGVTYGARALIYEDCRRDLLVTVGSDLVRELAPPLSLLLTSARWYTHQLAERARTICWQTYQELVQQTGSAFVEAMRFASYTERRLMNKSESVHDLALDFRRRWSQIMAIPAGQRTVQLCSETLRPQVEAQFQAAQPGWRYARYHSPDIMIAATSLEAIQQGDYQFVLGELHSTANTLAASLWLQQYPDPEQMRRDAYQDIPEPHLIFEIPKPWPNMTARTRCACLAESTYQLLFGPDPTSTPPERVIPLGGLVVTAVDGTLQMQTRDGRLVFEIAEGLSNTLTYLSSAFDKAFGLTEDDSYSPRVIVDKLILARESWRFDPLAMEFAQAKSDRDCFLAASRWREGHGIPRFAFVRVPIERKPFFVDFHSPIYLNILAKMVQRTIEANKPDARIAISEMLPRPDQVWLTDAAGHRYTSELRFVALDLS
jgi:hypothetical protein